jgi:FkbM family methyltransferase
LILLPRYIKNLGFYIGLMTFLKVELFKLQKFAMPPYTGFFHLRPGTSDIKVFREIFLYRIYSVNFPTSPSVIVDAGANIGFSSIFLAHQFPNATIYSIEPETSNFVQLQKNTRQYPNIKGIQAALWDRETQLRISDPGENHWAFTVTECPTHAEGSFRGLSLGSFMMMNGIEEIDLLKLDIEGAEYKVFSGDYSYWLSRTKIIIIELHDWQRAGCSAVVFKAIAQYPIKTTVCEGMLLIELNP